MVNRTVVVVDYDEEWPRQFENLRARIWPVVSDVAIRIEHVGSTSVPGLAAKPIIDMTVVVGGRDVPLTIKRLATLGYRQRGNLGIEDREAIGVVNQLAVRDYLRAQPDAARHYGNLRGGLPSSSQPTSTATCLARRTSSWTCYAASALPTSSSPRSSASTEGLRPDWLPPLRP
jgi:GrpB-like predicted nucleotidyltransferase (UPF0157 family)